VLPDGVIRAGVSKCGAQFETLLRGTTQWFEGAFRLRVHQGVMIEIGRRYKGEARKGDTKTSQAETSMDSAVKPIK